MTDKQIRTFENTPISETQNIVLETLKSFGPGGAEARDIGIKIGIERRTSAAWANTILKRLNLRSLVHKSETGKWYANS